MVVSQAAARSSFDGKLKRLESDSHAIVPVSSKRSKDPSSNIQRKESDSLGIKREPKPIRHSLTSQPSFSKSSIRSLLLRPSVPEQESARRRLYALFDDPQSSRASLLVWILIIVMIIVSVVSFIVETLPQFRFPRYPGLTKPTDHPFAFEVIEIASITVFTLEYVVRLSCVTSLSMVELQIHPQVDESPMSQRARKLSRFMLSPLNLVDLAAVLPFYVGLVLPFTNLQFLRVLRLARVMRVLKLGKYSEGLKMIMRVMERSTPALTLLTFLLALAGVLFASLIFFAEQGEFDPVTQKYMRWNIAHTAKEVSPFHSIVDSFYWVFTTTTTVGYGDFVPTTAFGKVVAVVTMHVGIIAVALPISIIGSNFAAEYERYRYSNLFQGDMQKELSKFSELSRRSTSRRPFEMSRSAAQNTTEALAQLNNVNGIRSAPSSRPTSAHSATAKSLGRPGTGGLFGAAAGPSRHVHGGGGHQNPRNVGPSNPMNQMERSKSEHLTVVRRRRGPATIGRRRRVNNDQRQQKAAANGDDDQSGDGDGDGDGDQNAVVPLSNDRRQQTWPMLPNTVPSSELDTSNAIDVQPSMEISKNPSKVPSSGTQTSAAEKNNSASTTSATARVQPTLPQGAPPSPPTFARRLSTLISNPHAARSSTRNLGLLAMAAKNGGKNAAEKRASRKKHRKIRRIKHILNIEQQLQKLQLELIDLRESLGRDPDSDDEVDTIQEEKRNRNHTHTAKRPSQSRTKPRSSRTNAYSHQEQERQKPPGDNSGSKNILETPKSVPTSQTTRIEPNLRRYEMAHHTPSASRSRSCSPDPSRPAPETKAAYEDPVVPESLGKNMQSEGVTQPVLAELTEPTAEESDFAASAALSGPSVPGQMPQTDFRDIPASQTASSSTATDSTLFEPPSSGEFTTIAEELPLEHPQNSEQALSTDKDSPELLAPEQAGSRPHQGGGEQTSDVAQAENFVRAPVSPKLLAVASRQPRRRAKGSPRDRIDSLCVDEQPGNR